MFGIMDSSCLICNVTITSLLSSESERQYRKKSISSFFRNMWSCFCQLFKLDQGQWNDIYQFYNKANEIPFCPKCTNLLAQLFILRQQLEGVQEKITKISSIVTQSIIETTPLSSSSAINFDSKKHGSTALLRNNNGHQISHKETTLLRIMTKAVCLRNNIYQNYNPHVVLKASPQIQTIVDLDKVKTGPSEIISVTPAQPEVIQLTDEKEGPEIIQISDDETEEEMSIIFEPQLVQDCLEVELRENSVVEMEEEEPQQLIIAEQEQLQEQLIIAEQEQLQQQLIIVEQDQAESIQSDQEQQLIIVEGQDTESSQILQELIDPETPARLEILLKQEQTVQNFYNENEEIPIKTEFDSMSEMTYDEPMPVGMTVVSDVEEDKDNSEKNERIILKITRKSQQLTNSSNNQAQSTSSLPVISLKSEDVKCELCDGKTFANNFNLMRHMRTIHKKTVVVKRKKKIWKKSSSNPGLWKNDEDKFEYGGWTFEKIDNMFVCECGVQHCFMASIRCHIRVHHLAARSPTKFSTGGGHGDRSRDLCKGKFAYKDVWKFEQKSEKLWECCTCLVTKPYQSCRFYCKECNLGFIARTAFLNHEKRHEQQRWWRVGTGSYIYDKQFEFDCVDNGFCCGTCGHQAQKFWHMTQHIRDTHSTPDKCVCSQCGQQFSNQSSLAKHGSSCAKKDFHLTDDGLRLLYRDEWLIDILDPSKSTSEDDTRFLYRCSSCGHRRKDRGSMFRHIRERHIQGPRYQCGKCDKTFDSAFHMRSHTRSKHSLRESYFCDFPECDKKFKIKKFLIMHQRKQQHFLPQWTVQT